MQYVPESPLSSTLSSVPSADDILSLYRSLSVGFLPEVTEVKAYIKFYNKSDFELRDCSVSDDDCIFTGLTWIKDANLMKNTFCFLAYIPVPPSQEKDQYTYTTTLSKPIGFLYSMVVVHY